ncbi:MAG TPA: hypothetical protein VKD69_05305 [Vicinamibacterales bacterium]|nr:hypothetical protein [Vicinamibacterales bacterium]
MIRMRLAVLALGLLTAAPAFAQTTVAGDWDVTINSPQGSNTSKVTFKQDANKLDGMIKSPAGETAIAGTVEGEDVNVAFTINFQGMPFEIKLNGKVAGDTITGKADFGGLAEGDWSAKRPDAAATASAATTAAPAAAAPAATATPAVASASTATTTMTGFGGKWDVMLKTPAGDLPANANLTVDGGKLSGTFGSQMGEVPVEGTVDGNAMKVTMTAQTPQGPMTVVLTGDLDGDSIVNGKVEVAGMGQMEWTAKRIKQ